VTALDRVTAQGDAPKQRMSGPVQPPHHRTRLAAALDWLVHAQDVTGSGAFAPDYPIDGSCGDGLRGGQRACPDTTGPVIPTLYLAAWYLERPELAQRAERAAQWAVETQLSSGAVWGGVVGTGRALLGWLSAFAETGSGVFAGASRRAGRFLVATLDQDGMWWRDGARAPYTAWALAEAGRRLGAPEFRAAAARHLRAVTRVPHDDGWMRDYGAGVPERSSPLCDIADAIRGLLEGGRLFGEERLSAHAALAAAGVAAAMAPDGRLPGRFAAGWRPQGSPCCLVAQARMVNIWLRLFEITGATQWLEPVRPALGFLTSAQHRDGAIAGPARICSTATKLFVDALIRDERIARGLAREATAAVVLA